MVEVGRGGTVEEDEMLDMVERGGVADGIRKAAKEVRRGVLKLGCG
jgi:hypothetical protein